MKPSLSFIYRYPEGFAVWWWTAMLPGELHRVEKAIHDKRVDELKALLRRALEED